MDDSPNGRHRMGGIEVFQRELRTSLTELLGALFVPIEQADSIQKATMEFLTNFFAARDIINQKHGDLEGDIVGPLGIPGSPISNVEFGAKGGFWQRYQNGAIYYHPDTGAHWIRGPVYEKYLLLGAERGLLGYPLKDQDQNLSDGAQFAHFQRGSIYWTNSTGACEIHGAIRDRWVALGSGTSPLGYPKTDETAASDGEGRFNHFQRGSIYWTFETGAWEVSGSILARWDDLGREKGYLGYPTGPEQPNWGIEGQRIVRFQRGAIRYWLNVPLSGMDLPDSVTLRSGPLSTGEAITAWAELTIYSNGGWNYRGRLHDSGLLSYNVAVATVPHFQDANGRVLAFSHETHLQGTQVPDPERDREWNLSNYEPIIRDNWEVLRTCAVTTEVKVGTNAGDVIELILVGLAVAFAVGFGIFVVHLFASGDAKVCPPQRTFKRNPDTLQDEPAVVWPIGVKDRNDPRYPNYDPCEGYPPGPP
jgi:hypothetical protein